MEDPGTGIVTRYAPLREWTPARRKECIKGTNAPNTFAKWCKVYAYVRTCVSEVSMATAPAPGEPPFPNMEKMLAAARVAENEGRLSAEVGEEGGGGGGPGTLGLARSMTRGHEWVGVCPLYCSEGCVCVHLVGVHSVGSPIRFIF